MMDLNPENVAREAAQTLSDELAKPKLCTEVEGILREGPDEDTRLDGATIISIAALVVASAQLVVAIYGGRTGHGAKTTIEMNDELGKRLKIQSDAPPETVEKITRHTVNALFKEPK